MNIGNKKIYINGIGVTLNSRTKAEIERDTEAGTFSRYEARLYNKNVRALLENGERNDTLWADSWADPHYETVTAETPEQAIQMIFQKFPEKGGFVITDIIELEPPER
ncbi:MAG: hypothetical protein CMF62_11610 [Magnetococcales bacterium]|jgi:hypothetical protein|nr:hypothetical protein [Magnetococcales bacterium]|tara:strand:- start:295065 stop:295388 length:324 start_codon:yes stop_codon:yes gene_type:complete